MRTKKRIDAKYDPHQERFIVVDRENPPEGSEVDDLWLRMEVDIGPDEAPPPPDGPRKVQTLVGGVDFLNDIMRDEYGAVHAKMSRPELRRITAALRKRGMELVILKDHDPE